MVRFDLCVVPVEGMVLRNARLFVLAWVEGWSICLHAVLMGLSWDSRLSYVPVLHSCRVKSSRRLVACCGVCAQAEILRREKAIAEARVAVENESDEVSCVATARACTTPRRRQRDSTDVVAVTGQVCRHTEWPYEDMWVD